jgi:acyl-CoA synthetase (AMP-forming)/AMP-acid ligase II
MANLTQIIEFAQPESGGETFLSGFPFFHLAGLCMGLNALALGCTQVLIPDPRNTKHIVAEIRRYRPTVLVNVPSLFMMLLETPGFDKVDHTNLNFCISGAAPFPADAINALEKVLGKGKLVEVYGMTEASPLVTMNPRHGTKKIGTVGLPLPSTYVRLVDIETGTRDVPVGQEGEIIVHGPQVMQGYLDKPEETANQLRDMDGKKWLYTGDVARMDEDGYFTIADRTKDMLIVGGYKVFSREVEEKLYDHPAIELCAIIGVPNPDRPGNDRVKLVVQVAQSHKNKDPKAVEADIIEYCKANLAPYKVPKIVEFVDEVPLTAVGKVDKKALR